jgi:hypothetical protein
MIKHLSQLATLADYKKACSGDGKSLSDKPTPFVFFPKFAFSKTSTGPVLLLGSVPGAVMSEAKKKGGACITGKASLNAEGKIALEGTSAKVDASAIQPAFAAIGVSKKIAASSDDEPASQAKPVAKKFPDPLTTPAVEPPLKTKALGKNYEGEDKKLGWRAQGDEKLAETDRTTTLYANERLKKKLEIGFDGKGHLIDSDGKRLKDESIGFVADPETGGGLHQFDGSVTLTTPEGKAKRVHHSTPLSGKPVSGAGTIDTNRKGTIKEITDQSGHYKPGGDLTFQTVKAMAKEKDAEGFDKNLTDRRTDGDGVPMNKPAKVTLVGKKGIEDDEWKTVKGNPAKINELVMKKFGPGVQFTEKELDRATHEYINILISQRTSVSVTSQQYLQTEGNETAIRAKKDLNKEFHSKISKVKKADNADAARGEAKMTAAEMRKLGINPMAAKGVTTNASPTTRHTPAVAKKIAAEANKGRKPAPATDGGADTEGESPSDASPAPGQKHKLLGYVGGDSADALSASQEAETEETLSTMPADAEPATDEDVSGPLRDEPGSTRNPKAYSNPEAKSSKSGYVGDMDSSAVLGSGAQNTYAYKPFKPGKKGK